MTERPVWRSSRLLGPTGMFVLPRCLRRNVVVIHPWKIAYLRIPKVANSSVKKTLAECLGLPQPSDLHPTRDRYWRTVAPSTVNLIPLLQFLCDPSYSGYWSFAIVREPLERLASCYRNKIIRNRALSPGMLAQGFRRGMSFDQFVRRVCEVPEPRSDAHLAAQSSFVCFRGRIVSDLTLQLEQIDSQWELVQREVEKRCGVSLPALPITNVTNRDAIPLELTAELRELIARRYAADFRLHASAGAKPSPQMSERESRSLKNKP